VGAGGGGEIADGAGLPLSSVPEMLSNIVAKATKYGISII
jgi:hypothetical protein